MIEPNMTDASDAGAPTVKPSEPGQALPDREVPTNAPAGEAAAEPLTVDQVKLALRRVKDPELNLNILDLGLVYGVELAGDDVRIDLTMTSPACPLGDVLVGDVEKTVRRLVPSAARVDVRLVWDPPWTPERMSEAARRQLGW